MSVQLQIMILGVVVSVACSLVGTFLVLRKMSMMTDAISHTILLGIVVGFFITKSLTSIWLIIGAGIVGVLTVYFTEMLVRTRLVNEDASIGLVFPLLFSIAILIISKYGRNLHLDVGCVMLGEIAFAPLDGLIVGGIDFGAKSIYSMGFVLIINLVFIVIFYKELKIATFDEGLAFTLGLSPVFIHYLLMSLVSITAVGAFNAVGSILVIAFMIGSPVSAYLLTTDLKKMLIYSALIGAFNSIVGYQFARLFDVSIAGMMAVVTGIVFILIFVFSRRNGLITGLLRRKKQRFLLRLNTLLFHLYINEVHTIKEMARLLNWKEKDIKKAYKNLSKEGLIIFKTDKIVLTEKGETEAVKRYKNILGYDLVK